MRQDLAARLRRGRDFVQFVLRHFAHDSRNQHAVVLTYTTLFAVVPMMTVTFAILSSIPSMQAVSDSLQQFIFRHFIPSSGLAVQQHLQEFSRQARHLTFIGSSMLFVTAILMLVTIEKAFNQIWRVREGRKGMLGFLRYWAVLSLGPLLLGAGFALSSYMMSLQLFSSAADLVNNLLPGMRLLTFMLGVAGFTLLYLAVPNCRVPFRAALAGGVVAALLFEGAKSAFTIFISKFSSYTLVYGAFAAFPAFLLWIYLGWSIVLLGVEVSRALTLYRLKGRRYRHPVLALMDVLQLFSERHREGGTVSDLEIMGVLGEQEEEAWLDFAPLLEKQHLIRRTDSGSYLLARDLGQVDFYRFYRSLPWPLPTPADLDGLGDHPRWLQQLQPALVAADARLGETLNLTLGGLFAGPDEEDA